MFYVLIRPQDEQGKRKCTNGYRLLDKRFSFSKERTQRNSKPQEMVSVRSLYTIAKKKGALIAVSL